MRPGSLMVVVALAALAGGCGDETGILVRVTAPPEQPPAERLVFYVGEGEAPRYRDATPDEDVDVRARDLAAKPYRLLLRPSDRSDVSLLVAAVAYAGDEIVGFGRLPEPVGFAAGVVRAWDLPLGPPDGVTVGDTGCLSFPSDDGTRIRIGRTGDLDCDGWTRSDGDCDDRDHRVHPGRSEVCGNEVDDDCNGAVDEDVDGDGDGYTTCGSDTEPADCDDGKLEVHPGAEERCDGLENDCSGACDLPFDADQDGYTTCGSLILEDGTCEPPAEALVDCDDHEPWVHPFKDEICDGLDNDCNGVCDDGLDGDGDGFNECGSVASELSSCALMDAWVDCAPADPAVHPAAAETCDGIDQNCDSVEASSIPCFAFGEDQACRSGIAPCVGGALGTCGPTNTEVPEELCAETAKCTAADLSFADCFATPPGSEVCVLSMQSGGGLCPGSNAVLLPQGTAPCTWSLLGAPAQFGFGHGVEVLASNDPAVCSAVLWLGGGSDDSSGGQPFEAYVLRNDANGLEVLYVHVVPSLVADCTGVTAVECSSWTTVVVQ